MMRPYCLLLGLLALASCDQKSTSRQETLAQPETPAAAPAKVEVRPRAIALADTATPYTTLLGFGDSARAPTQVRLNGGLYRLQIAAATDSARPLRYTYPPSNSQDSEPTDSAQNNPITGFEGTYTFRLLRPDGKPQFVQKFSKADFAAEIGEDMAVEAAPILPVFSGYLPQFKALAFELSFYPPNSDDGGELLLLLDATTGRVLHKQLSRWNSGCNSPTALSPNGRTLLTSFEILQANGRSTNFDNKPGRSVAGTLLVNDQTVLVVYMAGYDKQGHETPLKGPNAELIDVNGRRLASFNLESVDGGLGYRMLTKYVGQTRTHYLFDEANRKVGIFSAVNPTAARVVKLNQLPLFRAPQHPTEVKISFNPETNTQATIYVDTVSNQLRYRLRKQVY